VGALVLLSVLVLGSPVPASALPKGLHFCSDDIIAKHGAAVIACNASGGVVACDRDNVPLCCTKNQSGGSDCEELARVRGHHHIEVTLGALLAIDQVTTDNLQKILDMLQGIRTRLDAISSGGTQICSAADLVPVPRPGVVGPKGQCREDGHGNLLFVVGNQSGVDMVATTTSILFQDPNGVGGTLCGVGCTQVDIPTPAVPGFSQTVVQTPEPAACANNSTCLFTVVVNSAHLPGETDYVNNTAQAECDHIF
jgi:hypothetical protein